MVISPEPLGLKARDFLWMEPGFKSKIFKHEYRFKIAAIPHTSFKGGFHPTKN